MMKRTIYLVITLLLGMPMAGGEASAQSIKRQRGPQINMGFHFQDRMGSSRMRGQKRRPGKGFQRGAGQPFAAKMWMLTNELDLSEKQAAKLFPRMKDHQKQLDKLSKKHRELYKAFDRKIEDENASVKDIEKFADELAKIGKERIDLKTRFIKSTKDILKPDQQAVFAIFEERSMGKLRKRIIDSRIKIKIDPRYEFYLQDDDDDD